MVLGSFLELSSASTGTRVRAEDRRRACSIHPHGHGAHCLPTKVSEDAIRLDLYTIRVEVGVLQRAKQFTFPLRGHPSKIMPIHETEDPAHLSALSSVDQAFLVFYSSRDESGKLWCPVRIRPDRTRGRSLLSELRPDNEPTGLP